MQLGTLVQNYWRVLLRCNLTARDDDFLVAGVTENRQRHGLITGSSRSDLEEKYIQRSVDSKTTAHVITWLHTMAMLLAAQTMPAF